MLEYEPHRARTSWKNALYVIARFGGDELAYEVGKFFMYQWHSDGQALYVMLARTELSIEDIAWRVGYEDASAFHRLFKRLTRVT